MKNYQSPYRLFALLWVLCITLAVSSCKEPDDPDDDPIIITPNPCANVQCNFGQCVQGTCNCDYTQWEGINCATCKTNKYEGTYTVDETCNTTHNTYTATISSSSNACDGDLIFDGMTHTALHGHVSNLDGRSFTLNGGGVGGLSGHGTINADNSVITFTYGYWDGATSYDCTITMTRQ